MIGVGVSLTQPTSAEAIGGPGTGVNNLLLESGDELLLESGDVLLLE